MVSSVPGIGWGHNTHRVKHWYTEFKWATGMLLALAKGACKSSCGGVGDKRTQPGVTEESQGDYTGAMPGVKAA